MYRHAHYPYMDLCGWHNIPAPVVTGLQQVGGAALHVVEYSLCAAAAQEISSVVSSEFDPLSVS